MLKGGVTAKMNMGKRISAAIVLGLLASSAAAEDSELKDYSGSYMCRPIGVAGIGYDENRKEWQATTFNANKRQHFVKYTMLQDQPENSGETPFHAYQMLINRADLPGLKASVCKNDLLYGTKSDILPMYTYRMSCSTQSGEWTFSFDNMRYQLINDGGYLIDAPVLTPFIEVGTCVRLD